MDPAGAPEWEEHLVKRARRQRRWLLAGALWVMSWATLVTNDLLLYNDWTGGLASALVFDLIVSFPMLLMIVPLAMIGRYAGNFGRLRPYRYHLALLVPLVACVAINIPTAIDRVQPHRRFERATGVAFPVDARIHHYSSTRSGLDSSYRLEFSAPERSLAGLLERLDLSAPDPETARPRDDTFDLKSDQLGVLMNLKIDWKTPTAVFEHSTY